MLYLLYSNLVAAGRVWLEHGRIPAALGLWWTHIVVLLLALALLSAPRLLARLRYRESLA
jgi:lipopolysaccharide export system permease protein